MPRTLESSQSLIEGATADAASAAARAGIRVTEAEDLDDVHAISALFSSIWSTSASDGELLPPELLRALTHAGNYAAGAYFRGRLVGAAVAFLGQEDGEPYLHSHILGVLPEARGSNVGFALKLHQRAWALMRDLRRVTWTFDPLVGRNAHFNLQKLGARAIAYHESFYGTMRDSVNVGDETDRLLVEWRLDEERTIAAASGGLSDPDVGDGIFALAAGPEGEPHPSEAQADVLLCAVPRDAVALRRADTEQALRWRLALRRTLGSAVRDGYTVSGFARAGCYVLARQAGGGRARDDAGG